MLNRKITELLYLYFLKILFICTDKNTKSLYTVKNKIHILLITRERVEILQKKTRGFEFSRVYTLPSNIFIAIFFKENCTVKKRKNLKFPYLGNE